jgi:hypothetical protein
MRSCADPSCALQRSLPSSFISAPSDFSLLFRHGGTNEALKGMTPYPMSSLVPEPCIQRLLNSSSNILHRLWHHFLYNIFSSLSIILQLSKRKKIVKKLRHCWNFWLISQVSFSVWNTQLLFLLHCWSYISSSTFLDIFMLDVWSIMTVLLQFGKRTKYYFCVTIVKCVLSEFWWHV